MIAAIFVVAFVSACSSEESPQIHQLTVTQREKAIDSAMDLLHSDRSTEALAITSMLIQKDPLSSESQETHALALLAEATRQAAINNLGKADTLRNKALTSYSNACKQSADPGLLQLSTAQLAQMIGKDEIAITYYKRAHDNVPTDARASFFLAQIAMLNEQWDEGYKWISQSLQRSPNEPFALLSLALIEAERENIETAIELAQEGCSLLPNEPKLRFIQARVMRIAQNYNRAMEILLLLPKEFRESKIYQDEIKLIQKQSEITP